MDAVLDQRIVAIRKVSNGGKSQEEVVVLHSEAGFVITADGQSCVPAI
jgi:hypothetical protein